MTYALVITVVARCLACQPEIVGTVATDMSWHDCLKVADSFEHKLSDETLELKCVNQLITKGSFS